MEIVNLTPHQIDFVLEDTVLSVPPSGIVARVATKSKVTDEIEGIPVKETEFGEIENLPEEKEGKIYLVSSLVAQRCKGRKDVFIPNEPVRDDAGRIIGCKSLGRI